MKTISNKQGMPLLLWGWTFLIAIFTVLLLILIFNYRTKYILKHNESNIVKHQYQHNPLDYRLDFYFIGSSLINNALIQDNSFDNLLSGRNLKINYEIAISDGSNLNDFNNIIDEIRKQRPKYLIIESNVICINQVSNFRGRLLHIPQNLFKVVSDEFKLHSLSATTDPTHKDNKKLDFDNQGLVANMANNVLFKARKIDEFPLWNEFF
jgi:hypothetical protein